MAFKNARLPVEVEMGAQGGPLFQTTVLVAASGDEQRIAQWDQCRGEWDVGYGISTKDLLDRVNAFHRAAMGKFHSWKFKDWADFEASPAGTPHQFGTGDGTTTTFQLTKTYSMLDDSNAIVESYVRDIRLPISASLTIKINDVTTAAYTLLGGGLIQFNTAPGNGLSLKWLGEFDCVCRFDVDKLNVGMMQPGFDGGFGTVRGIRILEVLDAVT